MEPRLLDYTARDAVKLFAKLYVIHLIGDSIALAMIPRIKAWSQEQEEKRAMRKNS